MAPNVPRKLLLQDRLVQDPVNALQEILDHFQAGVHTIRSLFLGQANHEHEHLGLFEDRVPFDYHVVYHPFDYHWST